MGEALEADDIELPTLSEVEPIKSAVVNLGLISFPDLLGFWRRWRHSKAT